MDSVRVELSPASLQHLSVAAQSSLRVMEITGRMSDAALDWAKRLLWLNENCGAPDADNSPAGAADTRWLLERVSAVEALQAETFDYLRLLQDQLVVMLDVATSRGHVPIHLLAQLRATVIGAPTIAKQRAIADLDEARYRRMPVNQSVDRMAGAVVESCIALEKLNSKVARAMQGVYDLPEEPRRRAMAG